MNKNPLVSIILPTYNVARFLKQCLDSLNIQTYTNYECIIIVDGATDGSYEIAKEYCESHDKFTVYWQENAGSGPARNNGIDHANGELIMFVDPDDWIESDFIERHVEEQQKGDYDFTVSQRIDAYCDKYANLLHKKIIPIQERELLTMHTCRINYLDMIDKGMVNAPTRKVYKKRIIDENNVRFPDLRRSQDVVFNYRYYNCISSVRCFDYHGYNYRIIAGENIGRVKPDHVKILSLLYTEINDLLKDWGINVNKAILSNYFFRIVYTCVISNVSTNNDIISICEHPQVREISVLAKPTKLHFKITKWCIDKRHYTMLSMFMKCLYRLKARRES